MFSRHSVQIAALFSDVFGKALPNLCRSFYNETKAEMFFSVFAVALLAEGVDRNKISTALPPMFTVALLAEGVDRNISPARTLARCGNVALLAEGVDRNMFQGETRLENRVSPSSRRAWIEIPGQRQVQDACQSPSSRRAWIEIRSRCYPESVQSVALLAEGVDRNFTRP